MTIKKTKPLFLKPVHVDLPQSTRRPPVDNDAGDRSSAVSALLNPAAKQLIAVRGVQLLSNEDTDLNGNGLVGADDRGDQYVLLENVSGGQLTVPEGASLELGSDRSVRFDHEVLLDPMQELRVMSRPYGEAGIAAEAAAKKLFPKSAFYFVEPDSTTQTTTDDAGLGLHEVQNEEILLKIGGTVVSGLSYENQSKTGLLAPAPDERPSRVSLYRDNLLAVDQPTKARLGIDLAAANPNQPDTTLGVKKLAVRFTADATGIAKKLPAEIEDGAILFEQPAGEGTLDVSFLVIDRLNHRNDSYKATLSVEGANVSDTSLPISGPNAQQVTMRYGGVELDLNWDGDEPPNRLEVDPNLRFISSGTGRYQAEPIRDAYLNVGEKGITVHLSTNGEPGFINGRLTFIDTETDRAKVIRIEQLAIDTEKNEDPRIEVVHNQAAFVGEPFVGDIPITLYDPNPLEVRDLEFVASWTFQPKNGGQEKQFEAKVKSDIGDKAEIGRSVLIEAPPPLEEPGQLTLQIAAVDPRGGVGSAAHTFPICSRDDVAKVAFDTQYIIGNDPTDVSIPLEFMTPITTASATPMYDDDHRPDFSVMWVAPDGTETDLTKQSDMRQAFVYPPWNPGPPRPRGGMSMIDARAGGAATSPRPIMPPVRGGMPGGWQLSTKLPEGAGRLELREIGVVATEYTPDGAKQYESKESPSKPLLVRQTENKAPEITNEIRPRMSVVKGAGPLIIPVEVKDETEEALRYNFASIWTDDERKETETMPLGRRGNNIVFESDRLGSHQIVGNIIDPHGGKARIKTEVRVLEHPVKPPEVTVLNPNVKANLEELGGRLPPISAKIALGDTPLDSLRIEVIGTLQTVDDNGQTITQPFRAKPEQGEVIDGSFQANFGMKYGPKNRDYAIDYAVNVLDLETFDTVEKPGRYEVTVGAKAPVVEAFPVLEAQRGKEVSWPVMGFDPNHGPVELTARILSGGREVGQGVLKNNGSHHRLDFLAPDQVGRYTIEISGKDPDGVTKQSYPLEVVDFGDRFYAPAWSGDNSSTSKDKVVLQPVGSLEQGSDALQDDIQRVTGREAFRAAGPYDFPRTKAPGFGNKEEIELPISDGFAQYNAFLATEKLVTSIDDLKIMTPIAEILKRRKVRDGRFKLKVNDLYEHNAYASVAGFSTRYGYTEGHVTAADKDVVWHELGHCMGEAMAPGFGGARNDNVGGAIHEGLFGDILASILGGDPNAAEDWNHGWPLRRLANKKTTENTSTETHNRGEVYGGLFWDVATGVSALLRGEDWQPPRDEAMWRRSKPMMEVPAEAAAALLKLWVTTSSGFGTRDPNDGDFVRSLTAALEEIGPSLGLTPTKVAALSGYVADLAKFRKLKPDVPRGKIEKIGVDDAENPFATAIAKALPNGIGERVKLEEVGEYTLEINGTTQKRFRVRKPVQVGEREQFVRIYDEYVTVRERAPGKYEVQLGKIMDSLKDVAPVGPAGPDRMRMAALDRGPYQARLLSGTFEQLLGGVVGDAENLCAPQVDPQGPAGARVLRNAAERPVDARLRVAGQMALEELSAKQHKAVGDAHAAVNADQAGELFVVDGGVLKMIIETEAITYLAPVSVQDGKPVPDFSKLERRIELMS